jgi:hypothetical protein
MARTRAEDDDAKRLAILDKAAGLFDILHAHLHQVVTEIVLSGAGTAG